MQPRGVPLVDRVGQKADADVQQVLIGKMTPRAPRELGRRTGPRSGRRVGPIHDSITTTTGGAPVTTAGAPAGRHGPRRQPHVHRRRRRWSILAFMLPADRLRRGLHLLPDARGHPDGVPQLEPERPHRHLLGRAGELPAVFADPVFRGTVLQHRSSGWSARSSRSSSSASRSRCGCAASSASAALYQALIFFPWAISGLPHRHPVPLDVQQRVRRRQRPADEGRPDRRPRCRGWPTRTRRWSP